MSKAGLTKGSSNVKTEMVGDLTLEAIIEIAKMKEEDVLGKDLRSRCKEIVGTCVSMGVTVEGQNPRGFMPRLAAGEFDNRLS